MKDKIVIDVGVGTGNIAFTVMEQSGVVFVIESASSLREFMRKKAKQNGITNLFVMDGFSHEIPLPRDSIDVVITSNAIGWFLKWSGLSSFSMYSIRSSLIWE